MYICNLRKIKMNKSLRINLFLILILFFVINICSGQILYHEFIPAQSVQTYEPGGDYLNVDINQDGTNDLRIVASCWFTPIHQLWNHLFTINNLTNVMIGHGDTANIYNWGCNNAYQPYGAIIDDDFFWVNDLSTLLSDGPESLLLPCSVPFEPYYYPVKIVISDSSNLFGYIKLTAGYYYVTLFEMAINLDTNQYIFAGQTLTENQAIQSTDNICKIYPNPASIGFEIDLPVSTEIQKETQVCLVNSNGQLVFQNKYSPDSRKILVDPKFKVSGLYYCIIRKGDFYYTEKIIFFNH